VDVRLLDGPLAVGPPGWGPDVVVCIGADSIDPSPRPHVRTIKLSPDDLADADPQLDTVAAIGLLAGRTADSSELAAIAELDRAIGHLPDQQPIVAVVLDGEPQELVEQLAAALSSDEGAFGSVVVITPDPTRLDVSRFEAAWPGRCLVVPRPVDVVALLATFAASDAVVSRSPFDRAMAAALGTRTAGTNDPESLLVEFDRTKARGPGRAAAALALDRSLDAALVGATVTALDPASDELRRLRAAHAAIQVRVGDERRQLADHLAELRVEIAGGEAREREVAVLRERTSAINASLAAHRTALVQLQEDCRLAILRGAVTPARRPVIRRAGGRLARALRIR
jgi:hypothetical protein